MPDASPLPALPEEFSLSHDECRAVLHSRAAAYSRDAATFRALAEEPNVQGDPDGNARMAIIYRTVAAELRQVAGGEAPPPRLRPGDRHEISLAPDAVLLVDASLCVVLATPERRITVGNIAGWRDSLVQIKVMRDVAEEEAAEAAEAAAEWDDQDSARHAAAEEARDA